MNQNIFNKLWSTEGNALGLVALLNLSMTSEALLGDVGCMYSSRG